ncbi:MAG: hypothetical protein F6K18_13950 [Okeania sp. SIO2C2]|nr:hypothetical protein [Okeania sp. SIO2C2]
MERWGDGESPKIKSKINSYQEIINYFSLLPIAYSLFPLFWKYLLQADTSSPAIPGKSRGNRS